MALVVGSQESLPIWVLGRGRSNLRSAAMDWVEAIGFRKEAVHTGALGHLLRSMEGGASARALTGDQRIRAINDVRTEVKLSPLSRRPIDLAASIDIGEEPASLGVEVKVDSAWSPRQLRETVPDGDTGVLLAVGYTALAIDDRDMRAISSPWRCVRPGPFAAIVSQHADGDRELLHYADQLGCEADDHQRAIEAVQASSEVSWGRNPATLEHWAYFGEVLREREDVADWERKALISGPLMTLSIAPGDLAGDYLEFMGEATGRRSLCAKTYAPPDQLAARRERLIELLRDADESQETARPPRPSAKTCTAARFSLRGRTPTEAQQLVSTLVSRIAPAPASHPTDARRNSRIDER